MNTKQPEALRIADDLRHSIAHYGREDALTFNAYEAEKCLRALHTEKEMLITGYDAARLEIESLHAQLAAVGAGGVEPLRKRECLHTISEPKARSEQEIVDQTEGLAKFLMLWRWGQEPESPAITMRNSINSKAKKSWHAACHIQELLTDTDPENAVAEVDDAITDPQRRKAMNKTAIDLLCEIYDDVVQGALPNPDDAWFENARAALAAAPAQPVAGQSQFAGEGEWSECAVEHVTAVLAAPHEWSLDYKVRYLYAAAPPPAQAQEDVRKPLAEEEIERLAEVHGSDIDGLARTNP